MTKLPIFDPLAEFDRLNSVFDSFFATRPQMSMPEGATLPLDIIEKDGKIIVRASLPGVKPEDVDVSIDNGVLTIRGELRFDEEHKDAKVYRREISTGTFARSIRLPDETDLSQVEATFDNGFVTVTVPRVVAEKPIPIKVPVKALGKK
jgi:HSP20 family protein